MLLLSLCKQQCFKSTPYLLLQSIKYQSLSQTMTWSCSIVSFMTIFFSPCDLHSSTLALSSHFQMSLISHPGPLISLPVLSSFSLSPQFSATAWLISNCVHYSPQLFLQERNIFLFFLFEETESFVLGGKKLYCMISNKWISAAITRNSIPVCICTDDLKSFSKWMNTKKHYRWLNSA